jgi:hypothetical protein
LKMRSITHGFRWLLAVLLLTFLFACDSGGGGGGDNGGGNGNGNHPPVITSMPDTTARTGVLYGYDVEATDQDNDHLTYILVDSPTDMFINATNGQIGWVPGVNQVGVHQVKVKVSDGKAEVFQEYTLTVTLTIVNHAPEITSVADTSAIATQLYNYDVEATDPDGDGLLFSLGPAPAGMTINNVSGLISWTPTVGQVGNYPVTVTVSDGASTDSQSFIVTVTLVDPPNTPPSITSAPDTSAVANEAYSYDVNATDIDGDVLTYSLVINPAGMTIDPNTGQINWTPTAGQVGNHQVKVKVSDGEADVFQEYTLTVTAPLNTAPDISSVPIRTCFVSIACPYTVIASDAQGDPLTYALVTFPAGMTINPTTGKITWTPGAVGNYHVEASVTDGDSTSTQKYAIRVFAIDSGIPNQPGCTLTSWWWNDLLSFTSKQLIKWKRPAVPIFLFW